MSEALERARKEAFVSREQAAAYLAQVKACAAEGYEDEDGVAFAARGLEEAQATLDAIDAAIAAEAPLASLKPARPTIEIGFPFGDGEELKFRATVEDLKELLGGFATGGIAGVDVEPGVVGERAGEGIEPVTPTADIMSSYRHDRIPLPHHVDLGEMYEVVTVSDSGILVRSLGKIVEVFENGTPDRWLYRVEVDRAAHCRLEHGANNRDIKRRHQRIGSLVHIDRLRYL